MPETSLARRLNLFDATMIVMGGIVGAGIFMNPAVVARELSSSTAALGAWAVGGVFALAGAFIYAELAARRPAVGGQYVYLRDAFNPLTAFLYAWTLLLVFHARRTDGRELSRRARGQQSAERLHGSEDRCDRDARDLRLDGTAGRSGPLAEWRYPE
jgi:hypothetical protein